MSKARKLDWVGTVNCEGGPVLLADLPDYVQWTGAFRFTELRELAPRFADATKDRINTLHYWGQFTDRLPAPFKAAGGHQFLKLKTEAEARAKLAELVAAVKAKFPKVDITTEGDEVAFVLPGEDDEENGMQAELSPASEYDASWQEHDEEEAWVHAFGKDARALFWDIEGAGVADVAVSSDGNEIVLLRTWVDEEEHEELARELVRTPQKGEEKVLELVVKSGHAAVMWSPVAPFQLEGVKTPEELTAKKPETLSTEDIEGVGTIIAMKAGRWAVSIGKTEEEDEDEHEDHDEDEDEDEDEGEDEDEDEGEDEGEDEDGDDEEGSWSARWCRLVWLGP